MDVISYITWSHCASVGPKPNTDFTFILSVIESLLLKVYSYRYLKMKCGTPGAQR